VPNKAWGEGVNPVRDFGFILKDLTRRYVLRFEQRARAISLTLPQCKVLVRLDRNQGISQARLAELADLDPMSIVRILDHMESEEVLERKPDPSDRRARRLYLTPRAKPLLDEITRLSALTRDELFAGISRTERDEFLSVLGRIYQNSLAVEDAPARETVTE
jgi:DNA-binding MarR family transcriptional regulator